MKQNDSVALCSLRQGDLLKNRNVWALGAAGLILLMLGTARAETPIGVPDKSHPESVTATSDGTLYIGSFNLGGVIKAAPGGKTEQFISPGADGSRSVLGVLADERAVPCSSVPTT
ncbi:hypothetical protein ACWKUA_42240 [Bradyrhizobium sp. LeoA1S1]|uniref:hypothetical protein n=1 Tax=Bradyrhizobium elkanii TaxID=29448 RepID=UPI000406092A|nr:hypothetical protein [Bradyrhizobium elkanii]